MTELNKISNSSYEILRVKSKRVSCQGPNKASSHPLVYLEMGDKDYVVCPYCSKFFTIKQSVSEKPF